MGVRTSRTAAAVAASALALLGVLGGAGTASAATPTGTCTAADGGGDRYRSQFITHVVGPDQGFYGYLTTNVDWCAQGQSVKVLGADGDFFPTTEGVAVGLSKEGVRTQSITRVAAGATSSSTGQRVTASAQFAQRGTFGPLTFDAGKRSLSMSVTLSPTGADSCTATPNTCYENR